MRYLACLLMSLASPAIAQDFELSGYVADPKRNYVIITTYRPFSGTTDFDTLKLDRNNNFSTRISCRIPFTQVQIQVDSLRNQFIMAGAGGQLKVDFRAGRSLPEFSGTAKRIEAFRTLEQGFFKTVYEYYHKQNYRLEKEDFRRTDGYFAIHDSITLARIDSMKAFFGTAVSPLEKQFIRYAEENYLASDLFYKQSYNDAPVERLRFFANRVGLESSAYYRFSDHFNLDNVQHTWLPGYQRLLNSLLITELHRRRKIRKETFSYAGMLKDGFVLIDELTKTPATRDNLKLLFLAKLTDELDRNKDITTLKTFLPLIATSGIRDDNPDLRTLANNIKRVISENKLARGSVAPNFELSGIDGKIMRLSDFKGKRLVIDISASWCSPCIAYIPEWDKRVTSNSDPNTVFIYLSIDNTKAEWDVFRAKHPAKGLQLFAGNGGFRSKFALDYEIGMLPNQVVIDANGKIEAYSFKD